jgi:hypothetical protein
LKYMFNIRITELPSLTSISRIYCRVYQGTHTYLTWYSSSMYSKHESNITFHLKVHM